MTINAILDVGVHAGDLQEDQALALMRDRGFQEEGEAVGKWRRALLTAGQLPTYFVGYLAVRNRSAFRVQRSEVWFLIAYGVVAFTLVQ